MKDYSTLLLILLLCITVGVYIFIGIEEKQKLDIVVPDQSSTTQNIAIKTEVFIPQKPKLIILQPKNNVTYDVIPATLEWENSFSDNFSDYIVKFDAIDAEGYKNGDNIFSFKGTSNQFGCSEKKCSYPLSWFKSGQYMITVKNLDYNTYDSNTFIIGSLPVNHPPVMRNSGVPIGMGQVVTEPGQQASFLFMAIDRENDNLSWTIDWGDGTLFPGLCPSTLANDIFNITHTYANSGYYYISAVVSDCKGGTDSAGTQVVVSPN